VNKVTDSKASAARIQTSAQGIEVILREIAIAAPFRASNELTSLEYDSRVICALIVKKFARRIRPTDFWKISIRINHSGEPERFEMLDGLLVVYRYLSIEEYLGLTLVAQQEFLLNFIGKVLREVFDAFGLPVTEVNEALRAVRQDKFENTIVSKKWTPSPSGKMQARVKCTQRFREAEIVVDIEADGRLIKRFLIAAEKPDEFIFGVWFNRLEWVNENQLRVFGAHGRNVDLQIGLH
jgi:hypothetical protein